MKKRFKLDFDGAGYMYPLGSTKKSNTVFRLGFVLDKEVDFFAFTKAVKLSYERYPQFFVRCKRYFFNYKVCGMYFDDIDFTKVVVSTDDMICKPFNLKDSTAPVIRFICDGKNVNVECFHGIADAPGLLEFLNYVVEGYLDLLEDNYKPSVQTKEEFHLETQDVFKQLANHKTRKKTKITNASYQFSNQMKGNNYNITRIKLSTAEIIAAAKKDGMNLGAYIIGYYMYTLLYFKNKKSSKNITFVIPVGLRKFFDSQTTRNAALFVEVKQPKNDATLEETLESVKTQMEEKVTKDHLAAVAQQSVKLTYFLPIKLIPSIIKKKILYFIQYISENTRYTTCVSNIGKLTFSPKVENAVKQVKFSVPKFQKKGFGTTLFSYGDNTVFEIASKGDSDFITEKLVELLKTKVDKVEVEKKAYHY